MPAVADPRPNQYRNHDRGREQRERDRERIRGRTSPPLAIAPGTPDRRPIQSSSGALLSLSQDITALMSLSFEATLSLVNDYFRAALGTIGVGRYVRASPVRCSTDTGSGLAVVVVGAAEPTGQSLTLRLAKSGYTVFPLMPVNSSAPAPSPLSTLLLAWSGMQKRIQARDPGHTGAVVPVIIDNSGDAFLSSHVQYYTSPPSPPKTAGAGRFTHAGDTVRAYCHENKLSLVAIVCAAPSTVRPAPQALDSPQPSTPLGHRQAPVPGVPQGALAQTDEEALLTMYTTHILDPVNAVRALGGMLVSPRGSGRPNGRVLFVEAAGTVDDADLASAFGAPDGGAGRMIAAARAEAANVLREELSRAHIDVCEIVVGPMCPSTGLVVRSAGGDSDSDKQFAHFEDKPAPKDDVLSSRIRLLARVLAVDDALLYACVRRAIEDRYPRARHHAGLGPLIASVVSATPGSGVVRSIGRWVLGRLFPRPKQPSSPDVLALAASNIRYTPQSYRLV